MSPEAGGMIECQAPTDDEQGEEQEETQQARELSRILVIGAGGALGRKLTPSYEHSRLKGVEIYAADIMPKADFKPKFTGFAEYFNVRDPRDKKKLFELGLKQHFNAGYDASWPHGRIFNLIRYGEICDHMISTKPFTPIAHLPTLRTFVGFKESAGQQQEEGLVLEGAPAYRDVIDKTVGHDHYANKPGVAAVLANLQKLHSQFGRFFRITILITEQRDVNHKDEQARIRALDEGMIPDLDSHGVLLIQRLTPVGLIWQDSEGNRIKRFWRRIIPTACVRAQMRNAFCQGDTACIAEYEVEEGLCILDEKGQPFLGTKPMRFSFFVLVVCGKGLKAESYIDRDLKAMEIAFQGQGQSTGIIDFGTNQVNQMLLSVLGSAVPDVDLRVHGGINLPIQTIIDRWPDFTDKRNSLRSEILQPVDLLFENMCLLDETMRLDTSATFPAYDSGELVHRFLNAHVNRGNGFRFFGTPHSGWPTRDAPMFMMMGRPLENRVD